MAYVWRRCPAGPVEKMRIVNSSEAQAAHSDRTARRRWVSAARRAWSSAGTAHLADPNETADADDEGNRAADGDFGDTSERPLGQV